MFDVPLNQVTERELQDLVDNQVREDKHLDYKETLDIEQASERKEFCADVSSFANTDGGYLIYGMKKSATDAGLSSEVCGLELKDPGKTETRLGSILQTGLDPRLSTSGVHIQPVELPSNGKWAVIVHVRKSFRNPHMVKDNWRFYVRSATESRPMDTAEVRAAFEFSGSMADRIHNFRTERLSRIMASEELPVLLDEYAPKLVLHMIPLSAFNPAASVGIKVFEDYSKWDLMGPLVVWEQRPHNLSTRFNLDGIARSAQWTRKSDSPVYEPTGYVQLFRNGTVEIVDVTILGVNGDKKQFLGEIFEIRLLQAVKKHVELQRFLGIEPPVFVMVGLLGVEGYKLNRGANQLDDTEEIDRANLIIPESIIDTFDSEKDHIATIMRPIFDTVWNTANYPFSPNYDKDGKYKRGWV